MGKEDWGRCHGEGHQAERRPPPQTAGAAHWEQVTRSESVSLGRKTKAEGQSSPKQPRERQANLEWGSDEMPSTQTSLTVGLAKAGSVLTTAS